MEKNTERLIELTLFRVESKLESAVGSGFDNETLMMMSAEAKASASIDLEQGKGCDTGHGLILELSGEGWPVPLDRAMAGIIRKFEFSILEGMEPAFRDFLRGPGGLKKDELTAELSEIFRIEKRAKLSYRRKMDPEIWQAAKRYVLIMGSDSLKMRHRGLFARLLLYRDLMEHDGRLSGMNIEEALLIRREAHDRAVRAGDAEGFTLVLSECLLEAVYRGSDVMKAVRETAGAASDFLSRRMEKERPYSLHEIASLFDISDETAARLFVIPALTGNRLAVDPRETGEDLYRLIG